MCVNVIETLQFAEFSSYLSGFSALEHYFGMPEGSVIQVETEGSIVDLSRLFDGISFPGPSIFDAVLERDDVMVLFRCIDDEGGIYGGETIGSGLGADVREQEGNTFGRPLPPPSPMIRRIRHAATHQGSLLYDILRKTFVDRRSVYYSLRDKKLTQAQPSADRGGAAGGRGDRGFPSDSDHWDGDRGGPTESDRSDGDRGNGSRSDSDLGHGDRRSEADAAAPTQPHEPHQTQQPHGTHGAGTNEAWDSNASQSLSAPQGPSWYPVFEAALIVARLGYEPSGELKDALRRFGDPAGPGGPSSRGARASAHESAGDRTAPETRATHPSPEPLTPLEQRFLLSGIITGKWAGRGLALLMESGFVDAHWPLLSSMAAVDHTKEHHPEGNVWRHTVEAFAYRKIRELPLSLGLLLHDCGKPFTGPRNGNAFDRHAQIGADKARRFMYGLGYSQELIDKVEYFVQNHMLPTYIPKIPFNRTEDVLASPLFPELLELYRCDVSSTFRGPEGYYNACAAYRSFLKNRRNPFRSTDGKKRLRLLVE